MMPIEMPKLDADMYELIRWLRVFAEHYNMLVDAVNHLQEEAKK